MGHPGAPTGDGVWPEGFGLIPEEVAKVVLDVFGFQLDLSRTLDGDLIAAFGGDEFWGAAGDGDEAIRGSVVDGIEVGGGRFAVDADQAIGGVGGAGEGILGGSDEEVCL
ncbi:MAG: hypothetical protein J0H02_06315 [Armatimonadetes bacterium]|nr:hypothetical protein [Armatimonadota bacterium]